MQRNVQDIEYYEEYLQSSHKSRIDAAYQGMAEKKRAIQATAWIRQVRKSVNYEITYKV